MMVGVKLARPVPMNETGWTSARENHIDSADWPKSAFFDWTEGKSGCRMNQMLSGGGPHSLDNLYWMGLWPYSSSEKMIPV